MNDLTTQNLSAAAFDSLPQSIKDWVSSMQATYLIMDMNKRLGLKGDKASVIPSLVFRLITQSIDPLDFINELSYELNISFQVAKSITQDIETNLLKPIEAELKKDVGVDVKLIYFAQPAERKQQILITTEIAEEIKTPVPPTAEPIKEEIQLTETAEPQMAAEEIPTTPFIIHKEEIVKPITSSSDKEKSFLNLNIKNYFREKPASKPVSVNLETEPRVVNYSEFKTPINKLGLEKKPAAKKEDKVNLETFTKIEGNKVDLRQIS